MALSLLVCIWQNKGMRDWAGVLGPYKGWVDKCINNVMEDCCLMRIGNWMGCNNRKHKDNVMEDW